MTILDQQKAKQIYSSKPRLWLGLMVASAVISQISSNVIELVFVYFGDKPGSNLQANTFFVAVSLGPMIETFIFLTAPSLVSEVFNLNRRVVLVLSTILFGAAHYSPSTGIFVPVAALVMGLVWMRLYLSTQAPFGPWGGFVFVAPSHALTNFITFATEDYWSRLFKALLG